MVTVREAFDNLGFVLKADETVCIGTLTSSGGFVQQSLESAGDEPVGTNRYYSTGTFKAGTDFTAKKSRSGEHVMRILELPFDFDLKDFLQIEKAALLELPDDELDGYLDALATTVEGVFQRISLPINRLDQTGYGISAHIVIPNHEQEAVPHLRTLHAGIVRRINREFGGTLADEQVKDAGSRVMRLVPCLNRYVDQKTGVIGLPRTSRTLYAREGGVDQRMLEAASERVVVRTSSPFIGVGSKTMSDVDAQAIVDAYMPHHQPGQKHIMGLAIAGQLGKAGVSEEQAVAIIEAIAIDDNKPWDRVKAVRDTYDKLGRGVDVAGYYTLRQMVPAEAITYVDQILEKVRSASASRITLGGKPISSGEDIDDKKRPVKFDDYPEPPDDVLYGWIGEYVNLMHPTSEASKGFHFVAGMTVAGSTVGRRIAIIHASDFIYPNQYNLLCGPTGSSRKGTSMKRAVRLPAYQRTDGRPAVSASPFAVRRDLGSGAAVVKTLRESPNALMVFEEATTLFANMHRQGGEALLDRLIEAWDTPDYIQDNVKNNPDIAYSPFMGILAGIQPGRLEDALGANEIEAGLANRMGIFFGVRREIIAQPPKVDPNRASDLYSRLYNSIMSYPPGTALEMDRDAEAMWQAWYVSYSTDEGTEDEEAMRIRHPIMVQKWALLYAIFDQSDCIRVPHLNAAIAVLDWMWDGIKRRLPTWGVSIDNKIEELIKQTLEREGAMKRRELQQKTSRRKWSGKDFASVFRAMVDNGVILTDATGTVALAAHVEAAQAAQKAAPTDEEVRAAA